MSERGTYRSIPCALLAGKDFRKLPERPRWIFFVLKMNSSAVGLDTWYQDELLARLSSESGASTDQVDESLTFLDSNGWTEREDNIVWVKGHITHDPHLNPANPKHRKSVQRHIAGLPRIPIVMRFCFENKVWIPKGEATAMGISWVFDGYREPMPIRSRKRIPITKEDVPASGEANLNGSSGEVHTPWPVEGAQIWSREVSPITEKQFGGMMKPVVDATGWPDTKAGMLCFIELKRDQPKDLSWYRKDANRYIRLAKMPVVDPVTRQLTEKGRMA